MDKFSKVAGYKIGIHKSVVFPKKKKKNSFPKPLNNKIKFNQAAKICTLKTKICTLKIKKFKIQINGQVSCSWIGKNC